MILSASRFVVFFSELSTFIHVYSVRTPGLLCTMLCSCTGFKPEEYNAKKLFARMPARDLKISQSKRIGLRARSHCGKENAKRCVFMTVARQNCILEYGVFLSCKRGLKRTQTQTGVSEGGGGEDLRKRKRSQTRAQKCTLFFAKTKRFLLPAFSKF